MEWPRKFFFLLVTSQVFTFEGRQDQNQGEKFAEGVPLKDCRTHDKSMLLPKCNIILRETGLFFLGIEFSILYAVLKYWFTLIQGALESDETRHKN